MTIKVGINGLYRSICIRAAQERTDIEVGASMTLLMLNIALYEIRFDARTFSRFCKVEGGNLIVNGNHPCHCDVPRRVKVG